MQKSILRFQLKLLAWLLTFLAPSAIIQTLGKNNDLNFTFSPVRNVLNSRFMKWFL
jgi:hypothetical protein